MRHLSFSIAFVGSLLACLLLTAGPANAGGKPVKVFVLAGQSNMDGQAQVRTIDFLG